MQKTEEAKLCLYCEKPIDIRVGRKDRRFCDEVCKNKYHNTKTWNEEQEIKRIQLLLKKNRRILKKMFARKDKDEIDRERLLKEGFNFDFHTHFVYTKNKPHYQYIVVFDYAYRPLKENKEKFKVVKAFEPKNE